MEINESIVIGVSGASAQPLAERTLQLLLQSQKKIHLILSKGAYEVWNSEIGIKVPLDPINQENFWRKRLKINTGELTCYRWNDMSAVIASGSYKTKGMVIVPCTMGKVARISSGISSDLIERAADVHLKESKPLLIAPRESPLSLIHLRNLCKLSEAGAKIIPSIPAWYTYPKDLNDMIDFIVIRLLDNLNLDIGKLDRWKGRTK